MTHFVAVVASVVAAASPQPSAAPAASAPPAAPTVLRRLTYKVSYSSRREVSVETYAGRSMDNMEHPVDTSRPQSTVTSSHDEGTLDIEVTGVASDGIAVRVGERWNGRGATAQFSGAILNDGSIVFGDQRLAYPTRYVLAFLAPKIAQDHALVPGEHWSSAAHASQADSSTSFVVKDQLGDVATLDETQTIHVRATEAVEVTTQGNVRYKPSRLVALSGTLQERTAVTAANRIDRTVTDIQFDRQSDSLDR